MSFDLPINLELDAEWFASITTFQFHLPILTMFAKIALLFVALVAFASAFAPSARFVSKTSLANANCDEYKVDKNGRCPGDTGYVSFVKDNVPKDFAVSLSIFTTTQSISELNSVSRGESSPHPTSTTTWYRLTKRSSRPRRRPPLPLKADATSTRLTRMADAPVTLDTSVS